MENSFCPGKGPGGVRSQPWREARMNRNTLCFVNKQPYLLHAMLFWFHYPPAFNKKVETRAGKKECCGKLRDVFKKNGSSVCVWGWGALLVSWLA